MPFIYEGMANDVNGLYCNKGKTKGGVYMALKTQEKIPIEKKYLLTAQEASEYTGICINAIYKKIKDPDCSFVIYIRNKRLIKRTALERYLEKNQFF